MYSIFKSFNSFIQFEFEVFIIIIFAAVALTFSEYGKEFGFYWPLSEKVHQILDENHSLLIETIDPCELVGELYSAKGINLWQREFIDHSKTISHQRNVVLLDILRRSSFEVYNKLINCLEKTRQPIISNILKEGGGKLTNLR